MAAEIKNELGTITLNEELIANLAGYAAVENYGIVGMKAKKAGDSIVELFGRDNLRRGVRVALTAENSIDVDLFVTLEYGVAMPAVAQNTRSNVKYRVEELTGLTVRSVNVYVEDIRVDMSHE